MSEIKNIVIIIIIKMNKLQIINWKNGRYSHPIKSGKLLRKNVI